MAFPNYKQPSKRIVTQPTPNKRAAGAQRAASHGVYTPGRPGRIDARPRNVLYAPGTGPGTGRPGIRTGMVNRDGSTSPLTAMGSPTGPLVPPRPSMLPGAKNQSGQGQGQDDDTDAPDAGAPPDAGGAADGGASGADAGGGGGTQGTDPNGVHIAGREGRIDGRPRNVLYAPGTGPGTGRTGIRTGIINRDGSTSPLSAMGSPMGPLVPPRPSMLPDKKPAGAAAGTGAVGAAGAPAPAAGTGAASTVAKAAMRAGLAAARTAAAAGGAGTASAGGTGGESSSANVGGAASTGGAMGVGGGASATGAAGVGGKINATAPPSSSDSSDSDESDPSEILARAKGGPVQAGRPYLVGEKGPEIIVPKRSGTVIPHHKIDFSRADARAAAHSARCADEDAHAEDRSAAEDDEFMPDADSAPGMDAQSLRDLMRPRSMPAAFAHEQMQQSKGGRASDHDRKGAPHSARPAHRGRWFEDRTPPRQSRASRHARD